jgi:DnaJ-class molecular chaperone
MIDNPYVILGIDKNASEDEIKKAYKRLALKFHPDKNCQDDSEFKRISSAYQMLIDPSKRRLYDMCGSKLDSDSSISSDELNKLVTQMFNLMSNLVKQRFSQQPVPPTKEECKPNNNDIKSSNINSVNIKSINLNIPVTIEELYNKQIKKINIKVKRFIEETNETKLETTPIFLSLLNYKEVYVFKEVGDEFIYSSEGIIQRLKGDIKVNIKITDHPIIRIDKYLFQYDLIIDDTISLYEVYFGINKTYKFFNNEELLVSKNFRDKLKENHEASHYSFNHVIKEKGLPYYNEAEDTEMRGDLYIFYSLKLNINDSDDNNQEFENLLKKYFNND